MTPQPRQSRAQITLARALSKFGFASRSKAAVMIREGHVRVDGRVVRRDDHWLDPRTAVIEVDGTRLVAEEFRYLAMHKPAGCVTTRADERGRDTVYAFLPAGLPWMFPVGRLDKESSGLLLFTNDVRWGEMISGPTHRVPKTYVVTVDRALEEQDLEVMRRGMTLDDGTALQPVEARHKGGGGQTVTIMLREGKNRQIRRMMVQLRYEVRALVRTAIGPITLKGLEPGQTRPVTRDERRSLQEYFPQEQQ
jgi:23S rRNA pseudouridine2605 synthase